METTIIVAEFSSLEAATAYRKQHGGWLFLADTGEVIWFDAAHFTQSRVFDHRATHGLCGHMQSTL
jgi:hypothetical protein